MAFDGLPADILTKLRDPPLAFRGRNLFIDGEFVAPHSQGSYEVEDPSTSKYILRVADGDANDVDRAMKAAEKALPGWMGLTADARADFLLALAKRFEDKFEYFVYLESFDSGKPLRESTDDVNNTIACLKKNAEYAVKFPPFKEVVVPTKNFRFSTKIRYEPVGVVTLITPWNYPLLMAMQKVAPALAAGCTCVLKPSEFTPFSCIEFAGLCEEVELPKGVFNLLTGLGKTTGDFMVKHPISRKISFTGSIDTGRCIMKEASEHMKPVHLELGGKSPMIVFDDVNIMAVIDWIMVGIFWGAGQVCSATSRVLVHEGIYDELCERLRRATVNLSVGRFMNDPAPDIGPMSSRRQYEKVLSYLKIAEEENLNMLVGEKFSDLEVCPEGFFVKPTIFKDVPVTSRLWVEEIFGPILCLRSFHSEMVAVREANHTSYGLAAAVMTRDDARMKRISHILEAGTVWENCSQPIPQDAPFGGYKMSGIGREGGKAGYMAYLESKTIVSTNADDVGHFYTRTLNK